MLNKSTGNMYPWVTHTWNVIKGKCPHDCVYCYMKVYPQSELHFDEKALNTDLGKGNTIFVGSSCDMWAHDIPSEWIDKTVRHCLKHNLNTYLFQTKNPARFNGVGFPDKTILGATIETNRPYPLSIGKAPSPHIRYAVMASWYGIERKMISIEPIMDFDLDIFAKWIEEIRPEFVSIGADSKNHNLPEPPPLKIRALICYLQNFTQVKVKDNMNRLLANPTGEVK